MSAKLMGFVRLARPANLPTAAADICAGMAIGLFFHGIEMMDFIQKNPAQVLMLVFSSIFLYAGGVVFNDVFDAKLDAIERSERPIPKGIVKLPQAMIWGIFLLLTGIILAFLTTKWSGYVALVLTLAIFTYDASAKKHAFFGPLNMGICRGLNLILGISVIGTVALAWIAIIPVLYIFAITLISRGEVHGNNKSHLLWAGVLFAMVIIGMAVCTHIFTGNLALGIPFLLLFAFLIFRPLIRAYRINSPERIKKAVISGVLSLIVMDACWMAGFSNWSLALGVLLFLPLSLLLSKLFAVT
ncbi:UbiA-like protein EboC [Maribacter sp. 2304DJ31-5]|uniref:UbiA-like protein EboC n=1 Tax=Maribacter sp. 2304DJ31-5 TaxID=3386273 RepID=UPI0039BC93E7